ncbi:MAG: hypothetical protein IJC63_09265, partial [Myxococcaceae bacterium]|nr:hypothetical protein [Myxococcaceae bacterium]
VVSVGSAAAFSAVGSVMSKAFLVSLGRRGSVTSQWRTLAKQRSWPRGSRLAPVEVHVSQGAFRKKRRAPLARPISRNKRFSENNPTHSKQLKKQLSTPNTFQLFTLLKDHHEIK